jgi:hypothetical protein
MQKSDFSRVSNSTPEECGECPKSDENTQAVYGCVDPVTYRAGNLEKWLCTIDKLSQTGGIWEIYSKSSHVTNPHKGTKGVNLG